MSNSAQHKMGMILESTYGTTPPATPAFVVIPHKGTTLALAKGSIESTQIRPDRQLGDLRHGNRQIGGEITSELTWTDFDNILQAVLCGTWATNVLAPGVVYRSYSILRQFTDQTGGGVVMPFMLYKGCLFNTLSLKLAAESMVEATFGLWGREQTAATTGPTGFTYTAASANKPFDSFRGSITVDGAAIGSVSELSITLENGIEPRFVLFSDKSNFPKFGKIRVTGSFTAYFDDAALLNKFNGEVTAALVFVLQDLSGHTYTFTLPRLVLTGGQPDVSGEDDVTLTIPFTATYDDAGPANSLSILRTT